MYSIVALVGGEVPVKPFPMSAGHALKIIQKTAKDSSKVGIPTDLGYDRPVQDWQHVITHRHIQRCLEDGKILRKPELDEYGNWKCQMQRFGSGALIKIKVVVVHDENRNWELYVTEWSKTDGP